MEGRAVARQQSETTLGEIGLQQFAPYLMNRIMGRYNDTLREDLRRQGLSVPQARALACLSVMDRVTVNDLSVYTVIEQSTLSRTLDNLEAQGLVRRETSERDSRIKHVILTDDGRAQFALAWQPMREAFEAMFENIGDDEYNEFVATLQKVLTNIRKHAI